LSVIVPLEVPLKLTVTNGITSPVSPSKTRPVTVVVWAKEEKQIRQVTMKTKGSLILLL
jgi:hypothetical protein